MARYVPRLVEMISHSLNTVTIYLFSYVVKTALHLTLGFYMWYDNRRRDRKAEAEGTVVPEEERAKLAEQAGMVSLLSFRLDHRPSSGFLTRRVIIGGYHRV